MPGTFSTLNVDGEHAPADAAVQRGRPACVRVFDALDADVRQRHIDPLGVRGGPPLNAAGQAAFPHAVLPQDFPVPVGIDGVHDARLLAGQNDAPAVGQNAQDRRRSEVQVRTTRLRTVRVVLGFAAHVPGVANGELFGPQEIAGTHVEGHDRVARQRRRVGIIVARGHVDAAAFRVERRRRPDRGARRPPELHADGVLADRHRRVGNRVRTPDMLAVEAVQSHDRAAERAAFIGRIAAGDLLQRSRRCEDAVAVRLGRGRDPRQRVIVDLDLPDSFAGAGVQGVQIRLDVADVHDVPLRVGARQRIDDHRRAHAGRRANRPVQAARLGVDGIHPALHRPDEHPAADHGRLRGLVIHRQTEHPFDLEIGDLLRLDSSLPRGLEPGIEHVRAPAVPLRGAVTDGERPRGVRTEAGHRVVGIRGRGKQLAGQPFGHGPAFRGGVRHALEFHLAQLQRVQHHFGRQPRHDVAVRRTFHLPLVAARAMFGV